MVTVNKNYLKLPGSYLFSTIAKKVAAYQEANPDVQIVRLGIGDVTQPLAPLLLLFPSGSVQMPPRYQRHPPGSLALQAPAEAVRRFPSKQ